jgi:hypothetical protein
LLDTIQPFPAMFLGKSSLSLLKAYLDGISKACEILEKPFDWKNFHYFKRDWADRRYDFQSFLSDYFNENLGAMGWSSFILNKVDGDEERAIELFFALLEEFKLEKEI